ncbi:hypothetical protein [Blastococcus goldschmidtiae]|uniref:Uncharacterized protein n=1 Tax=Blastococcus goldschmidtiae TaxID=3075546 RepID=A0ABU2K9P5_9ACTN|nr:hypothetical protein [Blastococcus sp. DSM 46792]MDT0276858.1 hypothetical protein [Blastococcus sp. DSM 46792]
MADSATRSPGGQQWLSRAARWWAAGLAFVVGLLAGALLVGLLSGGGTVPLAATGDAAGTTAPGGADASPGEGPADTAREVVVNAACLRTVNAAQDVFDVVEDLGDALSELNAGRLDQIVRQLQPLQDRLEVNLAECNVAAEITEVDEEGGGGPAAPTTAPLPTAPPPTAPPILPPPGD